MKTIWCLLRETFKSWTAHKAPKMGAALAYYTALSLAPLALLTVSLLSWVVPSGQARKETIEQVTLVIGKAGGAMVESILTNPAAGSKGWWASLSGFVILMIGASGVFGELQDSLNTIWDASAKDRPFTALIRDRLLSFAMVLFLGLLMFASLAASAAITAIGTYFQSALPGFATVWELANSAVSFAVIAIMFAAVFRFLPDVQIAWRDVWSGAAITAALFVGGKFLLGFYLGHSAPGSAYGAAGSLIVVLLWVYYSAQIFFFGAEFTRASAEHRERVKQEEFAFHDNEKRAATESAAAR